MWRLVKFLFGQMPGIFLATVVALMFGAPPEDLLAKWLKPLWESPPDWLLSWQFRWLLLVAVLLIFFRRVLLAMDRRLVTLTVAKAPILNISNPDLDDPHKWLFGLTIKNDGTEDIEAKCLV